jgi:glycosyltransferase involved in cell wall biosynthesis
MEGRVVTGAPTVSVIIATYTRAALLDECLQHLARQQFATGDEVIVVDNGSKDHTQQIVQKHQQTFAVPLQLLYEATPGKSHALARALAVASGDVLAFLDDDVNVDARWLDVVRETMCDPDIALMGGRVVPRWEPTVPQWMRVAPAQHARLGAPLGLLDYPADVVQLGGRTVLGANMAVRRQVFESLGGFAAHLGKLHGTLLSGEDHELCLRVQRAGFRAVYVPTAVVHHWVPAERARVRYFVNWFYWSGITNAILDEDSGAARRGRSVLGLPLYLAKRAVTASLASAQAMLRGRRHTALHHAIDVAFTAGYAAKRWGLHS